MSKLTYEAILNQNKLEFENKTDFEKILSKWEKKFLDETRYYLEMVQNNEVIYWMNQYSFQAFISKRFGLDEDDIYRQPDEVFIKINENNINVYAIDKKNRNVRGLIGDELMSGIYTRKEYSKMLSPIKDYTINVEYGYCISKFLCDKYLSQPKYNMLKEILEEEKIPIFYGDDKNYFSTIAKWIS
jgi:hypothetical protein